MMALSRSYTIVLALVLDSNFATSMFTKGNLRQKFISTPDKPTRVFIGDNVSLAWSYYHPSHFKLYEVVLGIPRSPTGALAKKLVAVNASGFAQVRTGWESRLQWAGNLTSFLAVFVLHNVQPSDTLFGMHVEYDLHTPLIDTVRLQVETKPIEDLPRITFVTTPPLLRMGQKVSLNCTASSLSPVDVTWYRGSKVLASSNSVVVVTMTNITGQDWGEFLCVANNSVGEDRKTVILKVLPESPKILNTNETVARVNWTLRWSEVYSEGQLLRLYTVWHKVVHVTKDSATIEEQWLRVNVTGFMYHKELTVDRSYMFAVTAWNRWGESSLERDKIFSISTDFPDTTTKEKDKQTTPFYTDPDTTAKLSDSSNRKDHFMGITPHEVIMYITLPIVLCLLLLVVVGILRKYYGRKKNNGKHQDLKGISPNSFTSQETLTSDHEEVEDTLDERRSTILAETPLSMSESHLNSEETTASLRRIPEDCNQPKTGMCFVLSTFRPEMNTIKPGSTSQEEPSSSGPFAPYRSSERMEKNLDLHDTIIKASSSKEKNKTTKETNETSGTAGMVYEGAVHQRSQETLNSQALDAFRQKIDGFVPDTHSEVYLQPVDNNNLQPAVITTESFRLCDGKAQSLTQSRPTPKPRFKVLGKRETDDKFCQCKQATFAETLMNLQVTDMLKSNRACDTEVAQHCARVKPVGQSNHLIPQARTRHGQHGYQNDRMTPTPYQNTLPPAGSGVSPYSLVLSNTNWEVSNDHLSLFERIGGGSFGQVWKGVALDVAGAKGWSIVAVKMLKENSSKTDLRDLLSELDLLKKLKPHPNVIQLLGCLTKDVIRYKRGREFRPPLLILEFVPHGDLLGYLKKSRGETDDYYNLKSAEVPQKIPTQQLYRFASDIARGMEFISAHQLIHRDLAARNVLVGEGLRCKITDFGMARDLGKNEIYVRRSNGLMPVKWMAVESLTSQVFTTESDVWSYGIVLFEIFTFGGRPYDGMTGEEVFNYVSSGGRLPRTSAMSSELYNLMLECWHEKPCRRPAFSSLTGWTETLAQNDY